MYLKSKANGLELLSGLHFCIIDPILCHERSLLSNANFFFTVTFWLEFPHANCIKSIAFYDINDFPSEYIVE